MLYAQKSTKFNMTTHGECLSHLHSPNVPAKPVTKNITHTVAIKFPSLISPDDFDFKSSANVQ